MPLRKILYYVCLCAAFLIVGQQISFARLFYPTHAGSQSVGNYWDGKLINGKSLSEKGKGYQVVRLSRQRNYGHEDLIDFIEDLGRKSSKNKFGVILVGDMAKKNGGRIPGTHRSHQTGLDADIFFALEKQYITELDRESRGPRSILSKGRVDTKKWTAAHTKLLQIASEDKRVERIFVNHAIKKHLCKNHAGKSWLRKIRPIGGHTGHFHVRLACPHNSPTCKAQPKPDTNSC